MLSATGVTFGRFTALRVFIPPVVADPVGVIDKPFTVAFPAPALVLVNDRELALSLFVFVV